MGVMMLAAAFGSTMKIIADGEDADRAVNSIRLLIDSKFNED